MIANYCYLKRAEKVLILLSGCNGLEPTVRSNTWDRRSHMSKAFDSVLPSLTVAKLGAYGFNDKSLQLLRSCFKDRLKRVKVGKATSDWNVMKRGCPQGSSFGPTLWNLYQNDLSYHINEIANLNMYADDHQGQLFTVQPRKT